MMGYLRQLGRIVKAGQLAHGGRDSSPLEASSMTTARSFKAANLSTAAHRWLLYLLLLCWMTPLNSLALAGEGFEEGEAEAGNLMILGGGKIAPEARDRFVELAGGKAARIVLIPTASEEAQRPEFLERFLAPWKQYAPESLIILHAQDRRSADDLGFVRPLQEATGVWIGGGVQTRLANRYLHTRVEEELRGVRTRGGVVAGTSAGAAIMTRAMIADGMKRPVMAEGFDFFRGAIVDQHFTQRYRMPRLTAAVRMNPSRFGVGIDEETGLLISGDKGTVIGRGQVRFIATTAGRTPASPPLLVRDYSSGEEVALGFWRSTAGSDPISQPDFEIQRPKALVAESEMPETLSFSLLSDYPQVDSRR